MNRKTIIAALTRLNQVRFQNGLDDIAFDPSASTSVLNGILLRTWLTVTVRNEAGGDGEEIPEDYDFEMTINGQIGTDYYGDQGYSAKQFQDELKPLKGKKGLLNIHSGGGNVWDGFAIAEMVLNAGNINTKVLGIAASAADVIFQAGAKRVMPQMAMRMAHNASALFAVAGNAKDLTAAKAELDKTISRLDKHDGTLATMYANRSGQTLDEVKADMDAEEFMDGDESLEKGYCDELTSDVPVTNRIDLSHLKKVPANILNQFSDPSTGAGKQPNQKPQETTVNKTHKIALLNSWGVKLSQGMTAETVTDTWLDDEIAKGKPAAPNPARTQNLALLNAWGVSFAATATDTEIENLVAAGKPKAVPGAVQNLDDHPTVKAMKKQMEDSRREVLRNRITVLASEDRIPVNQIEDWVTDAFAATDTADGNPVINRLAKLEAKAPGVQNLHVEMGDENLTINRLDKVVCDLLKPSQSIRGEGSPRFEVQAAMSRASKQIAVLVNRMKKFDANGVLIGPLRDAFDARAAGIQNANSMSAPLLRQIILSEIMRAFRREFATLSLFSHNYKDVALQGTDKVEVPYYPLDTTASTEFVQATGYTVAPNAQTSNKEIVIGGIGNNVASSGSGRKYKPLQFSAYEIARQPWLNIAQLIVMAAEQLAIDIRADILGTHIKAANFGNAIWSGAAGAFDKSVFTNYLLNSAIKAFWPMAMRNCVLTPDFFTALIGDPGLQRVNESGTDESLRNAQISRLLSFASVNYDALLPVANFIRGGDGAVTNGPDLNLGGFIAYSSAILVATAPVMPGPATMRLLASYEQVTDEQTGLTFSYQYFGNVLGSNDNEIIECSYGSGLGEAAALKRITTAGV